MLAAYRGIFGIAAFRRFWLGFMVSELGDAVTRVAVTWYVYEITRSPEALSVLLVCYTAPILVGGLIAGSLLDRFDRRYVMVADNLVRGLAVALIPTLLGPSLWTVALGLFGFGAFSAPLTIWAQTLRMQIIPERLRGRSFALLRMLMQGGNPLGGLLGGLLLPVAGLATTIAVSSLIVAIPGVAGYRVAALRLAGPSQPDAAL